MAAEQHSAPHFLNINITAGVRNVWDLAFEAVILACCCPKRRPKEPCKLVKIYHTNDGHGFLSAKVMGTIPDCYETHVAALVPWQT